MKLKHVAVVAALIAVSSGVSYADTACSAGSVCTVTLTQSNVVQLAGVVVTVTINNTGPSTILSFQVTSNNISNLPNGIDHVGWNAPIVQVGTKKQGKKTVPVFGPSPSAASASSTNFGGNQAGFAGNNMDGFGSFNVQGAHPAGRGGFSQAITFTLNGLVTNFVANSRGNEFAAHVRFQNGCSGFIGGQAGTNSQDSNTYCHISEVPEPGTLGLMATGLIGLAGIVRRRLM